MLTNEEVIMKEFGAKTILAAMMLGVLAWMGDRVVSNSEAVIFLQVREKTHTELLIEIREDVKSLIRERKRR